MRLSRLLQATVFAVAVPLIAQVPQSPQGLPITPENQQRARDIFKQLLEIDTTHAHGSTTKAAEAMQARFLAAGFPASDMHLDGASPDRKNLVVRYHGKPGSTLKPVLVLGHLDVVEALRSDWSTDPFKVVDQDGYYQARGTQDMKDGDASAVAALLRMKEEGYVPDRDIIVALTADEETGSDNGAKWLVKHHLDWIDAAFVINPDTGGVQTYHGKVIALGVGATEKLYFDFTLKVTNRGGHSSVPRPDNAIYQLAHALERVQNTPFPVELNTVTRQSFEDSLKEEPNSPKASALRAFLADQNDAAALATLSSPGFNATVRTTCVATELRAGHAENALPETAEANINCRILPGHTPREVHEDLVRIVDDPTVQVNFGDMNGRTPSHNPDDRALPPPPIDPFVFGALRKTADEFYPGVPVYPHMGHGATDSIYTMSVGIPSYGVNGFVIYEGRAHGRDERILKTSFDEGSEFMYHLLVNLTEPGK